MIHIMKEFPVNLLDDGRALLNLACEGKSKSNGTNIYFSPIVFLAHHVPIARIFRQIRILSETRYQKVLKADVDLLAGIYEKEYNHTGWYIICRQVIVAFYLLSGIVLCLLLRVLSY